MYCDVARPRLLLSLEFAVPQDPFTSSTAYQAMPDEISVSPVRLLSVVLCEQYKLLDMPETSYSKEGRYAQRL